VGDLRIAFGDRLRRLREARGWSQERLSETAGLHFTYISQIERGARSPGLNVLARLAEALGVTLPRLVSRLSDKPIVNRVRRKPGRPRRIRKGS
jgi:transcriptional regulator with XRE-family HTH domain